MGGGGGMQGGGRCCLGETHLGEGLSPSDNKQDMPSLPSVPPSHGHSARLKFEQHPDALSSLTFDWVG